MRDGVGVAVPPLGTLKIPGRLSETECDEGVGVRRRKPVLVQVDGNGYFYMRLCWTGVGIQAKLRRGVRVAVRHVAFFLGWLEATG